MRLLMRNAPPGGIMNCSDDSILPLKDARTVYSIRGLPRSNARRSIELSAAARGTRSLIQDFVLNADSLCRFTTRIWQIETLQAQKRVLDWRWRSENVE